MSPSTNPLLIATALGCLLSLGAPVSGQTFLAAHTGQGSDGFGDSLAFLGDIDGDGRAEYLIGDPGDDDVGLDAGRVELRSGSDHSLLVAYLGGDAGDRFGEQLVGMGDLDGDGVPDWAVSSPRETPVAGAALGGRVALRSGATGAVIRSWTGQAGQRLGEKLLALDDVDGDGLSDVAFRRLSGSGALTALEIRSTGTGALLVNLSAWPGIASNYAYSLSNTGDLDGDGRGDIAMATLNWQGVAGDHRLRLHSSASGALIHEFLGVEVPAPNPAVATLGDLDDDGVDDLAYARTNAPGDRVSVVSGATFTELWSLVKPPEWGSLGRGIAAWPDQDGDGLDELAVQYHQGLAYDYRLSFRSGLDGTPLGHLQADTTVFKYFGARMLRGPDLDGDGGDDVLVGCSTPGFWNEPGAVRVLSGTCTGEVLPYGVGLAGSGGFTPELLSVGCPAPGVPATLSVRDGLGGAPATLLIGLGPASIPFKQGTLLVDPLGAALITVPLSTPNGVPAAGSFDFAVLMPDEPLLSGLSAYLQVLVKDVGAPAGWALSVGVEWRFG